MASKRKLPMAEWEIVEYYCRAADRKAQIKILAELNDTTKDVICEVLSRRGFDLSFRPPLDTENITKEKIMDLIENREGVRSMYDCEAVVDAYLAGKSDAQIAETVGGSAGGVWEWRRRRGLPNRGDLKMFEKKPKEKCKKDPKSTERKELVKLIHGCAEMIADYLIAQGVVVKEAT